MTQEAPMAAQPTAPEQQAAIREQVRERYAHAAQQSAAGILAEAEDCCSDSCCNTGAEVNVTASFGAGLYTPDEQDALPKTALLATAVGLPSCTRARRSSTSAPEAGSTCCSAPAGSARPARPMGWT